MTGAPEGGPAHGGASTDDAAAVAATRPPVPLRRHQAAALDRLAETFAAGGRRAWVVLPPGLGKTLTGLEAARRLGHRTVVLGPNTAIQGQWLREWSAFRPAPPPAGTDRALSHRLTVLTYQALASFDPDAEVDEEGGGTLPYGADGGADGRTGSGRTRAGAGARPRRQLDRLRPQGRELVAALRAAGRVTLLLDECHHLLDTWGELLAELLRELPDATVLGLTATPPDRLTPAQAALVEELFGPVVRGPSIPAAVREGQLAPYAELAWLTPPTAAETGWLAAETERFAALTTGLLDPGFAASPFLGWLDERVVRRRTAADGPGDADTGPAVPWRRFSRDHPRLARAALRFHHHGLLDLPDGARLAEEHRRPPAAEDWVCLLDDWVRHCLRPSAAPADAAALEAVRAALPAVGYRLTSRGVRGGRAPVDRVLARSAAKTAAVREILAAEHATLADRLRAVVVCDHERAAATLPADLDGVLDQEAGSARLVLAELAADPRTAVLEPLLVTGRTVAAAPATARRFAAFVAEAEPGLRLDPLPDGGAYGRADGGAYGNGSAYGNDGVVEITGRWTSRRWVALATRFFEAGGTRALVGTRGMLGEGWDARRVNTLVDLTEATTATAVVQIRGRALRLDPDWPEKTAHTWSVVCVAEGHPRGGGDWDRFVRKHEGHLGCTDAGEILSGVTHVHAGLSPYGPPPGDGFDRFNALMLRRAEDRAAARELWRVGSPYEDRLVHTVRVTAPRTRRPPGRPAGAQGAGAPPLAVPSRHGVAPAVPVGAAPWAGAAGALLCALPPAAAGVPPLAAGAAALGGWAAYATARAAAYARRLRAAAGEPVLAAVARAVADGLHAAGLVPRGAEAVSVEPDETGAYRVGLHGVPAAASERFATAFDEAVSPVGDPRYLLPRYALTRYGLLAGHRAIRGGLRNTVVHHAVPAALGENRRRVDAYAAAWCRHVSEAAPLYTRSPEGAGVLAAQAGLPPLDATTAMRVAWA
ncbi:DEAD/DEAH box helicase family protein [Streptomyces phytohabitans]|uniref:DEAD/DEAH box helicase family protein n=1 Tax=Streptomyces phytohabitans TaxID=1150371 RepID=UPI00345C438E